MLKTKSAFGEMNTEDWKRVLRTTIVIYTPVLLLFLTQVQEGKFDWKVLIALGISVSVDVIRRCLTDYTAE